MLVVNRTVSVSGEGRELQLRHIKKGSHCFQKTMKMRKLLEISWNSGILNHYFMVLLQPMSCVFSLPFEDYNRKIQPTKNSLCTWNYLENHGVFKELRSGNPAQESWVFRMKRLSKMKTKTYQSSF